MSVTGKRRAPDQPDYSAEEILETLQEEYNLQSDQDWLDRYDMTVSEAMVYAEEVLEKGQEDKERLKHEMRIDAMLEHEFESRAWTNETDEEFKQGADVKKIFYQYFEDPDNDDAWILRTEEEYDES